MLININASYYLLISCCNISKCTHCGPNALLDVVHFMDFLPLRFHLLQIYCPHHRKECNPLPVGNVLMPLRCLDKVMGVSGLNKLK